MKQENSNPFRGMLYGMANRLPNLFNPSGIWKLWDEFGIQDSEMLGYWNPKCPVKTDHAQVLSTVYKKQGKSLVILSSWAKETVAVKLEINWSNFEISQENVLIMAPFIEDIQIETEFKLEDTIPVEPGKGWFILLDGQKDVRKKKQEEDIHL